MQHKNYTLEDLFLKIMIQTQTNKNLIFFFSLLNTLKHSEETHVLGKELLEFLNYKELSSFEKFSELYKNNEIPKDLSNYCLYAINSNTDLTPKTVESGSGFGPKNYNLYTEKIQPLVTSIYNQSNFEDIYTNKILIEYKKLTEEIQSYFNGQVEKAIKDIWNIKKKYKFILIPNFLEISHSFGLFRKNSLYSITAPDITKKGAIEFTQQHTISNAIHEFSHSLFQKELIANNLYGKHKDLTTGIKIPNKLKNIHPDPYVFMEETLIKVITLLIQENLYTNHIKDVVLQQKSQEILKQMTEKGYTKGKELYQVLSKSENVLDDYLHYLSNQL